MGFAATRRKLRQRLEALLEREGYGDASIMVAFYLDDGLIALPRQLSYKALPIIAATLAEGNYLLRPDKLQLYCPNGKSLDPPETEGLLPEETLLLQEAHKRCSTEGIVVVGAPLGGGDVLKSSHWRTKRLWELRLERRGSWILSYKTTLTM